MQIYTTISFDVESLSVKELQELNQQTRAELAKRRAMCLDDSERQLIRDGRKIDAIKAVKNRTGCLLRDAKDLVDAASVEVVK